MEQPPQQNKISIEEAATRISALMQEELVKGAVDEEEYQITEIIHKLRQREINPEEALTQTYKIIGGRQDYH